MAVAALDGQTMVVYGGGTKDTSKGFSGDAFALRINPDTGAWKWTKLQVSDMCAHMYSKKGDHNATQP